MNNTIVGNKYIVKGFHEVSDRYRDSQHWVGKMVGCLYSDGEGIIDGDPENTCACKIKDLETGDELYSCAVYLEEYKEMKKLITEPIDFTGCIPEVAEALKRGLKVQVLCLDTDYRNPKIVGYDTEFGTYVIEFDDGYTSVTQHEFTLLYQKQTETRVKKASEIVKWLEDNGYKVDEDGDWDKEKVDCKFLAEMFRYCGKFPDQEEYEWLPEWLEEVEV